MKIARVLLVASLTVGAAGIDSLVAQIPGVPKFPGMGRHKDDPRRQRQQEGGGAHVTPPGVPVPPDSPLFDAFRKLEQQTVYHQRMTFTISDPQMAEMAAKMGMT